MLVLYEELQHISVLKVFFFNFSLKQINTIEKHCEMESLWTLESKRPGFIPGFIPLAVAILVYLHSLSSIFLIYKIQHLSHRVLEVTNFFLKIQIVALAGVAQ